MRLSTNIFQNYGKKYSCGGYLAFLLNCLLCTCTLTSCSTTPSKEGKHSNVILNIPNTSSFVNSFDDSIKFDIEKVITLEMTSGILGVKGNPTIKDDRIYLTDEQGEYVVVFDHNGKFLHKLGGRGHAKKELIGRVYNFDVDNKTKDVHIYDREGHKILVYDKNGDYKRTVVLEDCAPTSIKLSSNNGYFASCDITSLREYGPKLVELDENGKIIKSIIEDGVINKITCEGKNTTPFFSEDSDNIAYLPLLSDSIVVLKKGSVNSVINLNFDDGFPKGSELTQIKESGDISPEGTKYVSSVKVNDFYCFVHFYAYHPQYKSCSLFTFLYDRKTNKSYCKSGYLSLPRMIGYFTTIYKDNIVMLLSEDEIESFYSLYELATSTPEGASRYKSIDDFAKVGLNQFSVDLIKNKHKVPAIIFAKLR